MTQHTNINTPVTTDVGGLPRNDRSHSSWREVASKTRTDERLSTLFVTPYYNIMPNLIDLDIVYETPSRWLIILYLYARKSYSLKIY